METIQFWGINDTWGGENYGIPSGTYTPNVAVNGYYSPTPLEQVSVTLSGNPTSVSDHLFLGPGFNVSVYSIDWERPRVSRDWVWSGCQGRTIDVYGSTRASVNSPSPLTYNSPGCIGSEIDVGFYPVTNGTAGGLADYFGAETTYVHHQVHGRYNDFGGLFQGPGGMDCITGDQRILQLRSDGWWWTNVCRATDSLTTSYYGQSAKYAFTGGYTSGLVRFPNEPQSF